MKWLILLSLVQWLNASNAEQTDCSSRSAMSTRDWFLAVKEGPIYVIANNTGFVHMTCNVPYGHGHYVQVPHQYTLKVGLNTFINDRDQIFGFCQLHASLDISAFNGEAFFYHGPDRPVVAYTALTTTYSITEPSDFFIMAMFDNTTVTLSNVTHDQDLILNRLSGYNNHDNEWRHVQIIGSKTLYVNMYDKDGNWFNVISDDFSAYNFVVIVPDVTPPKETFLKIQATAPNTVVRFHNSTTDYNIHINVSTDVQVTGEPTLIQSNNPVFVYYYTIAIPGYRNETRSKVVRIPGLENFEKSGHFIIPSGRWAPDTLVVFAKIVYPQGSNMTIDNEPIPDDKIVSTYSLNIGKNWYFAATVNVSEYQNTSAGSYHTIRCDNGATHFGAVIIMSTMIYGIEYDFGYPITFKTPDCLGKSTSIPSHQSPPTTTTSTSTMPTTASTIPANTSPNTGGDGPLCLQCDDLTNIYWCASIVKCSQTQVCYVERYVNWAGHDRFRTGCRDASACQSDTVSSITSGVGRRATRCSECCHGNFCNSRGCGDKGFPASVERGPMCLSCSHIASAEACDTLAICESDEVCSVKVMSWFGGLKQHSFGCAKKVDCVTQSGKRSSGSHRRTSVLCERCCPDDFCNLTCDHETPSVPAIIG